MQPDALVTFNADVRAGRVPIFHGGVPGLAVGDALLPPAVTGVTGMATLSQDAGFSRITTKSSLVYVTTELDLATSCAACWEVLGRGTGAGWVYRVELDDEDLELDTDLPRGPFISFQLARARIAAVVDRGIDPRDPRHIETLARFVASIG